MIPTYQITKLPIPEHIVVIRGIWLDRQHVAGAWMEWAQAKAINGSAWERRYLQNKIAEAQRALGA